MFKISAAALSLTALLCLPEVSAHTPYLAPASFEPIRGWVSLEAAFAEKFFVPEAKFDQSEFVVTTPDGQQQQPKEIQSVRSRTVLDHELTADGTYRFSTGLRYGAVFRTYEHQGKTHNSRDPKQQLPRGAVLKAHFQSLTRAETYVSKGKPDHKALTALGSGLEFVFSSHPNALFAGESLQGQVLFNGKALANHKVELQQVGGFEPLPVLSLTTNAQGQLSQVLPNAAEYLLLVKHRAAAPKDAKAPTYSYSYSAVFEVTE